MDTELLGSLLTATKILAHEEEENKRLVESKDALTSLEAKHVLLKETLEQKKRSSGIVGNVIGSIIFMALGAFYLMVMVVAACAGAAEEVGVVGFIFVLITTAIIPLFVGIFWLLYAKKDLKPRLERSVQIKREALRKFEETELKEAKKKIEEQEKALIVHKADLDVIKEEVLAFLPPLYRDIHAVSFMALLIESGRAETLKEAMNMFEEERKYFTMLDAVASINRKLSSVESALQTANRYNYLIKEQQKKSYSLQKADFWFS